jgi:hypothetical protein
MHLFISLDTSKISALATQLDSESYELSFCGVFWLVSNCLLLDWLLWHVSSVKKVANFVAVFATWFCIRQFSIFCQAQDPGEWEPELYQSTQWVYLLRITNSV